MVTMLHMGSALETIVGPGPSNSLQNPLRNLLLAFSQTLKKNENTTQSKAKMGSRLGGRVVHFANLPIKLLMPNTFENIQEIALKTIPSASKIEIKRVLESLYGFEVEKVRTLNMEGKKKKRGGLLIAKPDYKKAYVMLKNPLSLSRDLFPVRVVQEEKERTSKEQKSSFVEDGKKHWLDGKDGGRGNSERSKNKELVGDVAAAKFPWSSMGKR